MTCATTCTVLATAAVCAAGFLAFRFATDDFDALTSETARRIAARRGEIRVPDLFGIDQQGRIHDLLSDPDGSGSQRVLILDFVSTRCETLCSVLGTRYQQLQAEIGRRHAEDKVRLLTVTLDPSPDPPGDLARYARRMHADPRIWTLMTLNRPEHLNQVLSALGVVVIWISPTQIEHNASFHLVDGAGRVVRIVDLNDPKDMLAAALSITRRPSGTS